MNRIPLGLLTLALFLAPIFCRAAEPDSDQAKAVAEIEKLGGKVTTKTNPSDPEAYIALGNLALREGRLDEVATDFDKAKQLLAASTSGERKRGMEQQVLSGLGLLAETREDWKEAEAQLRELLKIAPEDLVAHQRLARALFWQGKAAEAYDMLKKGKEIDRKNAKEHNRREVFLTPEAVMAQYYDRFEGPKSANPEKWFRAAALKAPDDLPTRQSLPFGPWGKAKSALPRSRRRPFCESRSPMKSSTAAATWAACSAAWLPCGRRTGPRRRSILRRF